MTSPSIKFRCIAIFLSLLGGLLFSELVLRLSPVWVGRHTDTLFKIMEYDPSLGWKLKLRLNKKVDFVDRQNIHVQTNSSGFWDKEFSIQKDPSRCRIAFLGDSFTWGLGVNQRERFTDLLEAKNSQWEAFNFGIPGYGTDQSLISWKKTASAFRPDLVVLTVFNNDYTDNLHMVRYGRQKPYFELGVNDSLILQNVPVTSTNFWKNGIFNRIAPSYTQFFKEPVQRRSRVLHWLSKNSDLARLAYTGLRKLRIVYSSKNPKEMKLEDQFSELTKLERTEIKLLGTLIEEMNREVKKSGARFLVVLSGNSGSVYEEQKKDLIQRGISYADATTESLANLVGGDRKGIYFSYNKHWTPLAHRAVASLLELRIREEKLCERLND